MGLFEKKTCSICGGKIGLLGNRKLEDGNLCKNCAGQLSPFFSERRHSTVEEIREQLAYREENRTAVAAFRTTRSFGGGMKLLLDEDAKKFMVTRARDLRDANPDVLDFSQVTACEMEIEESRSEVFAKDKDGKSVSYAPPHYTFSSSVKIVIRVNHPYFDAICFQLNPTGIVLNPDMPLPMIRRPDPRRNREFREYAAQGREIVKTLNDAREQAREESAPHTARICPFCGATTVPDENGCCEYCGSSLSG